MNMWANLYMTEWDTYCSCNPLNIEILSDDFQPVFKSGQIAAYWRFRSLMQVLDLCTLDPDMLLFDERKLVGAAMYLELAVGFELFNRRDIALNQQ